MLSGTGVILHRCELHHVFSGTGVIFHRCELYHVFSGAGVILYRCELHHVFSGTGVILQVCAGGTGFVGTGEVWVQLRAGCECSTGVNRQTKEPATSGVYRRGRGAAVSALQASGWAQVRNVQL